jgi:hypothetical protein
MTTSRATTGSSEFEDQLSPGFASVVSSAPSLHSSEAERELDSHQLRSEVALVPVELKLDGWLVHFAHVRKEGLLTPAAHSRYFQQKRPPNSGGPHFL